MGKNIISRRKFLGRTTAGIGLGLIGQSASVSALDLKSARDIKKLRREVKIASIDMRFLFPEKSLDAGIKKILSRMEKAAAYQPDIICLPESFSALMVSERRPRSEIAEDENTPGPVTGSIGEFAKKHNCYVICSTYTKNAGKYYNAAVLLGRQGELVGEFCKMFPTEGEIKMGISPGSLDPPVFDTDFGKIGMQICFDSEWIDGWSKLQKAGAEIVFWPSAYAGGKKLNAFAMLFNYYVVSSTQKDASRIIDLTGRDIASTGRWNPNWICTPINMEKEVITTYPHYLHFNDIKAKYGRDVKITTLYNEEISVIESLSADLNVADILKEFEIKTKIEYLQSAEEAQRMKRTN